MSDVKYYPSNVRVWCVITPEDGEAIEVPAVHVTLRFILNTIPTANVMLAVGKDAFNPTKASNAHTIGRNLKRGTKFEIWCNLTGEAGPLEGKVANWPGTDFKIFDGKIVTANPEVGNGLRVSVGAIHWLAGLDATCWLSSMLDPSGSFAIHHPTAHPMSAAANNPASGPSARAIWWLDLTGRQDIHAYNRDLWIEGLKPSLLELASNTTKKGRVNSTLMRTPEFLQQLYGEDRPNASAISVLTRMDNAAHMPIPKIPLFGAVDKVLTAGSRSKLTATYVGSLARTLWSPEGSYTLWSKLLRFLKFSILAISPGVETATVIPWMPVLNDTWVELEPSDVWSVTLNSRMPRSHRGLALILRGFAPWGLRSETPESRKGMVGFYDVTQSNSGVPADLIGEDPGTLTFQFAPPWIDPKGFGNRAPSEWRKTIPWVGEKGNVNPPEPPEGVPTLGNALAKAMFMTEVFKMRGGAVATRLRFDIAPGSMIKFKDFNTDYDVPGFTGDGVYANVTGVHVTISADPAKCGTTLQVSHTRLSYESKMSVDTHPIYGTKWTGGPLVNVPGVTPTW